MRDDTQREISHESNMRLGNAESPRHCRRYTAVRHSMYSIFGAIDSDSLSAQFIIQLVNRGLASCRSRIPATRSCLNRSRSGRRLASNRMRQSGRMQRRCWMAFMLPRVRDDLFASCCVPWPSRLATIQPSRSPISRQLSSSSFPKNRGTLNLYFKYSTTSQIIRFDARFAA
jgi:hypothetical protein